MNVNVGFQLLA